MIKTFLILLVIPAISYTQEQVTPTLLPHIVYPQAKKWKTTVNIGGNHYKGNVKAKTFNSSFLVARTSEHNSFYVQGSSQYLQVGENPIDKTINQGQGTFRYDYQFNDCYGLIFFSGHSYNQNKNIDYKTTNGIGPRAVVLKKKLLNDFSVAPIHQYIKYETALRQSEMRLSIRNYSKYSFNKQSNLELDLFYVPLFKDFNDYRFYSSVAINTKITENIFGLKYSITYEHDSKPQLGNHHDDVIIAGAFTITL